MRVPVASVEKPAKKKPGVKKGQPLPPPPSAILDGEVPSDDPDAPYRSRRFGRPSRLTQHVGDQILTAISQGLDVDDAYQSAGIPRATFYEWLERGEKETASIFAEFAEDMKTARARGVLLSHAQLSKAATAGSVQAITYKLDRVFAQKYGLAAIMRAKIEERVICDLFERLRKGADQATIATVARLVLSSGSGEDGDDRRGVVDAEFDGADPAQR